MILAGILFLIGLAASAFFSGTETGMYRVSRTRLVLSALGGSRVARGLVWFLNHPTYFVATALVGNNLANYAASSAIVIGVGAMTGSMTGGADAASASAGGSLELIATIILTPVVFVLGELVPKHLFYRAPYALVSLLGPVLFLAGVVLSPLAAMFSLLGQLLQRATGQTPFRLRLMMNRGQLDRVLRDGTEAGILAASQRELATRLFEIGDKTAISFAVPAGRLATVDTHKNHPRRFDRKVAKHRARRQNHSIVLIRNRGRIVGYSHYGDLSNQADELVIHPVLHAKVDDRHLRLLLRMYDTGREVAVLEDDRGRPKGVVTRRQLTSPIVKPV